MEILNHGMAFGKVVYLYIQNENVLNNERIDVADEQKKLKSHINFLLKRFTRLKKQFPNNLIIDSYLLFLQDESFIRLMNQRIDHNECSYIESFNLEMNHLIKKIDKMDNLYFKSRVQDLEDIKVRFNQVFFDKVLKKYIKEDIILVTEQIYPTTLIKYQKNIKGIIVEKGSHLSHGSFICKSLNIPFVKDKNFERKEKYLLLNTYQKNEYTFFQKKIDLILEKRNYDFLKEKVKQFYGIQFCLNASNINEIISMPNDFVGVGLYRTEYFYMEKDALPTEDSERDYYEEILKILNGRKIIFRTIDFGDDKRIDYLITNHKGFTNYRDFSSVIERQIRILCEAAENYTNVKIIFPMIRNLDDYLFLKAIFLKYQNSPIQIGIMLETKSAFDNLECFLDIDFISIGTNDLIKDLYQIDRINLHNSFNERDFLEKMKSILNFCSIHEIDCSICGNIFFKKSLFHELIQLGFKNFSINYQDLGGVLLESKNIIRG